MRIRTIKQMPLARNGSRYKKKAIPALTRRIIAERYGCTPTQSIAAKCKCGFQGKITWYSANGWVHFLGLELDHVIPECLGGKSDASNIQLLCRKCNRRKGWRINQ